MNKFLLSFIFCLSSLLSFAQSGGDKVIHFYVNTETGSLMSDVNGIDVDHADGGVANYTVTINSLVFSEYDCQCIMTIEANGHHPWEKPFIYRLKYENALNSGDSEDFVNVEDYAASVNNPEWNDFEVSDTHVWFKDTFPKDWIESEDLIYEVHDETNNHHLFVVIHYAFADDYVTGITDITEDTQTIYYDLQGHSSSKPFNGVNIVKNGNKTYKEIH